MNREETVKALLAQERYDFSDLMTIMRLLRAPGGCPWDIEQTHESIRSCMIEEAYEVVEAIDTANSFADRGRGRAIHSGRRGA